nr:Trafficking protein particle complex 8 [Polyrhizophydium stewartii]
MEGREFLALATSPLVAVAADTATVPAILAKCGVPDAVQFLRPFGLRHCANVVAQDVHGSSISLDPCFVRFADIHALDAVAPSALLSTLATEVVSKYASLSHQLPALRTAQEVEKFRQSVNIETLTPWFQFYIHLLSKYMGMSEHETFNHPVACLVVVSTSDPDPVSTAKALLNDSNLPPSLKRPFVDPYIQRLYLLIHDAEEVPHVDPNAILASMKRAFPTHLLVVNSAPPTPDQRPVVPDIWSPSIAETAVLLRKISSTTPLASSVPPPPQMNDQGFPVISPGTAHPDTGANLGSGSSLNQQQSVVRGQRMSISDFSGVETFIRDFLLKHVFDRMTFMMREWERDVASARRGISGRLYKVGLKYFSGSRTAAAPPTPFTDQATDHVIFPFLSPELIMRRLGDYAFMLRDFKYALSIYESVKKDFSTSEKFAKFFAGVQEMIAITSLMLTDSPKTNIDTLADTVIQNYSDAKCPLYSARAAMWITEMIKEHHNYRDAANMLIRFSGEESDLRGAFFMEQAAICYLRTTPPMPRSYTFHLMLASNRFSKCGLRNHAQRNYLTTLEAYSGLNWTLIEDHINFALGRQLFHQGNVQNAMDHFVKLLRKSRQSAAGQRAYLAEFLYIYQQLAAGTDSQALDSPIQSIPLPTIQDSDVTVYSRRSSTGDVAGTLPGTPAGQTGGLSAAGLLSQQHGGSASGDDDGAWELLEQQLLEFVAQSGSSAPAGSGAAGSTRRKQPLPGNVTLVQTSPDASTSTAVGEPVTVSFQWQNPLQVPIPTNNVFLECTFGDQPETHTELQILPNGDVPSRIARPEFELEVLHDVSLDSGEKRQVNLKIYPMQEGEITVIGVRYLLCGVIPSFRRFQKRGRRLNDTPAQRQDPNGVYAPDVSLKISVTPPMPVLDVVFHSFPESMLLGQVVQVALELNNKGTRGLKNLFVKPSHPTAFCFGDGTSIELPSYAPILTKSEATLHETMVVANTLEDDSAVALQLPLPDDATTASLTPNSKESLARGVLPPSQTTLVPVWLRADKPGRHSFKLLFMYQSENQGSYRTLRCNLSLQVYPSLRINTFTRTSLTTLNEFILGIEMENLHPSLALTFRQITSISPSWQIEPLVADEKPQACHLAPQQTQYHYFRIRRWADRPPLVVHQSPEMLTTTAIERLLLQEDPVPLTPPNIELCIRSLGTPRNLSTSKSFPLDSLMHSQRYSARMAHLRQQYPGLSQSQLHQLFTLIWTDDLDLAFFWESPTSQQRGHLALSGINLCLYSPLPVSAWLGHLDAKTLIGRALFSATVRERKALIQSFVKSRGSAGGAKDSSPVRVIVKTEPQVTLDESGNASVSVFVTLGNTSWMHIAEYAFEAVSSPHLTTLGNDPAADQAPNFAWVGQTQFYGTLDPEGQTQIELHACFCAAGLFDVNRWRLSVTLSFSPEALRAAAASSPQSSKSAALTAATAAGSGSPTASSSEKRTSLTYIQVPTMAQQVLVVADEPKLASSLATPQQ